MDLKEFAKDVASRINSFMESYINKFDDDAPELKESMRYGLLLGGKRARPLLVYATGLALGQSIEKLDYAAAAIECVHAYSLIHDDMPEMDNDKLRRGHDPIFMRLGQVAQRTGCAILLIGHLNKAAGMQSLQRGLGSIDIAAAVRSVMFIGKLKHDPTMRILTHEKSSLAPPGASLAFSLGDEGGFRWVGEYDITADEMLSGIEPQRETKTQQAKDLICTLLAGGKQVLSEDIDKAALERGIPGRTVRDAKRELGNALKSKIVEGRKKVFWME